jgi:hypothetical protein
MSVRDRAPLLAALFLLLTSGVARAQETWDPANTYVVMAGITEFQDPEFDAFPKRGRVDVKLRDQLLADGVKPENLVFLKDKEVTTANLRSAIADMAERAPKGSTFLFYFNGHGDTDFNNGKKYLITYDSVWKDLSKTGFRINEISSLLDDHWRGDRLLILGDNCYSGAFSSVVKHFSGTDVKAASLASVTATNMSNASNSYTEDLIKIFAGDGEVDRAHDGKVTFDKAATFLREEMRFLEDQPTEVTRTANFEPGFIIRGVDPSLALRKVDGPWQLRDFVDAKSDGHWFRAQILDEKDGRYKVRFMSPNWEAWEDWVDADALRQPHTHDVSVGDSVEVLSRADWHDQKPLWLEGVVKAVREGFALVHFDELPTFMREWVSTRLLHYGDDRSPPAKVVADTKDSAVDPSDLAGLIRQRDRAIADSSKKDVGMAEVLRERVTSSETAESER